MPENPTCFADALYSGRSVANVGVEMFVSLL